MEDYIHFPSESSSTCTDWCFPLHKIEFYMHRMVFSPSQSRVEHAQNAVFPSQNRLLHAQNGVFPFAESTSTSTEWCISLRRIDFYKYRMVFPHTQNRLLQAQNGVFPFAESTTTNTEWCFPLRRIDSYEHRMVFSPSQNRVLQTQNGVFPFTESTFFTSETTSRRGYECNSGGYAGGTNTGLQQILLQLSQL